jgi:hypothetical protein
MPTRKFRAFLEAFARSNILRGPQAFSDCLFSFLWSLDIFLYPAPGVNYVFPDNSPSISHFELSLICRLGCEIECSFLSFED